MSISKNSPDFDFLMTVYSENYASNTMLSDFINNRNNRLFLENLRVPSDFNVPFLQEGNDSRKKYRFRNVLNQKYSTDLNGSYCEEANINSGDYFSFTNKENNNTVKILFIASLDVRVGYKKYKLEKGTNIFIGRSPLNDISYNFSDYVSRDKHAAIRIDDTGKASLEDLKRSIGIYVNGLRTVSKELKHGDEISLMGLSILYMGDYIAVRNLESESSLADYSTFRLREPKDPENRNKYFISTPRILKSLDKEDIEIDAPPNPFVEDKTPIILTLGPSMTMSIVMMASLGITIVNAVNGADVSAMIASGAMAAGMLMGSLMWPVILRNYQKKRIQAEENHRKARYQAYIEEIDKNLSAKKDRSVRILNNTLFPSPEILCSFLDNERNMLHLWERSPEDEDFLDIRVGLGSRPFEINIKTPKTGFQLYEDELRFLPEKLAEKYSHLDDVPLTLNIRENKNIGIIGRHDDIQKLLNEIILNIIALHPSEDVKLLLIGTEKQIYELEKYKNIPHIWSDDKQVRFLATNLNEVHYLFNLIDDEIKQRQQMPDESKLFPYYVLIVLNPDLIEKEALLRYLYNPENKVGLTTIFAYGDIRKIPKSCTTIIQVDDFSTGFYIKNKNANRFIPFKMDNLNINQVNSMASKLSKLPIKRDSHSLGIADRISFLQMYKAGNVNELEIERRWENNNSSKSLAAPIGTVAGGDVFSLDIHEAYHGCHGLVAGTTGSGKSEFLQAFVLSLAINYSPKEVAFVLIDFKGGDMARPFMQKTFSPALPHLAATISNLSGNILYRALVSLKAEIQSRQRIFNESAQKLGIDKLDINSYHKYFKGGKLNMPLPHLVIVIDEFAQLKSQQPEFLAQLIDVAQVGRSLGIHLILATQKPSGIVDPQILSNSRFKICLKVSEKQDSIDVINRPDSALIKNPGRLNLQVGYDEIYETVQSGYSGADYSPTRTYVSDEEITIHMTDKTANPIDSARLDLSVEKSEKTQLEAIVSEIVKLGQKKETAAKPLWLDPLPERISLNHLDKDPAGLCSATVGLIDNVRLQTQKPYTIDFVRTGHIALYGASGTGKTTFLQTLIYSMVIDYGYTPEDLNIYAMDLGGRNLGYLSKLPHTGGVVFADDEDELEELVSVLERIIEERKQLFELSNCGTFSDYRDLGNNKLPSILVLIDNYSSLRDKYPDLADRITDVISSGQTFGIYFVITGNTRNSIYYKVIDHISSFITLRMNDPNNYLDILNIRPPVIPEDISGRGITVINHEIVEFQTAVAFETKSEADRLAKIISEYQELSAQWNGYRPIRLVKNELSPEITIDESRSYSAESQKGSSLDPITDDSQNLILGYSKSGFLSYGIKLTDDFKICICGDSSEQLKRYFEERANEILKYPNRRIVLIDDENGSYGYGLNRLSKLESISGSEAFDVFIEEMKPILNDRIENPNNEYEKIFLLIPDFHSFFEMITDDQADFMRKMLRFINNPNFKIYFLCGINTNNGKSNDALYMSLIVNADGFIISPGDYHRASSIIETIPMISELRGQSAYICMKKKSAEINW